MFEVITRKPVPVFTPEEDEVTAVTYRNGETAFLSKYDHVVHVYNQEIEEVVINWISQLEAMAELLEEDLYFKFGHNLDTLLASFKQQVEEIFSAVYSEMGLITCDLVGKNNTGIRPGRIMAIHFTPNTKKGE